MNLANKITITRILFIPVFMAILFFNIKYGAYIASAIFILAAVTDSVDGYIARSRKQITTIGKFLDPLADKLLITAALIVLVELNKIPSAVAMIIISREFVITGFRVIAASEGTIISASFWGKVKTNAQIVAIVSTLIDNFPFALIGFPFDVVAIWVAVVITIISGVDYIAKNLHILNNTNI